MGHNAAPMTSAGGPSEANAHGRASPPEVPTVSLEIVEDTTATSRCDEGYLRVHRRELVAHRPGQPPTERFRYDVVERWNQDAVGVLPHFARDGVRWVVLRTAVRPPVALRKDPLLDGPIAFPQGAREGVLWEIVAGLVEADERSVEGFARCAARELAEELGVHMDAREMRPLGGAVFPSAGIVGECIYFYEAEIDPAARHAPEGDGSPLERDAAIEEFALAEALSWCDAGLLPDAKTELSLRRLAARLAREDRGGAR
jgi:ADP-ribose pyrophosphatase